MTDPSSASTPTPQPLDSAEFKSLVLAERATHAARGYTVEHDREHGVTHLAKWATDYARRGEAVKAASLIAALADAHAAEVEALRTERDGLSVMYALLNAVAREEMRDAGKTDGDAVVSAEWLERMTSAAPSDALAEVKREAAVQGQLDILIELSDEEMQTNGATLHLERLLTRAAAIREGRS